jgi:hypothetical protein
MAVVRCRCRVMLTTELSSHAGDGTATRGCGKVAQPRARSIEVLSHCEEVKLACQSSLIFALARSRVITSKIS